MPHISSSPTEAKPCNAAGLLRLQVLHVQPEKLRSQSFPADLGVGESSGIFSVGRKAKGGNDCELS